MEREIGINAARAIIRIEARIAYYRNFQRRLSWPSENLLGLEIDRKVDLLGALKDGIRIAINEANVEEVLQGYEYSVDAIEDRANYERQRGTKLLIDDRVSLYPPYPPPYPNLKGDSS